MGIRLCATYLKEKITSKELNIDKHLGKISNYIERINGHESTSKNTTKVPADIDSPVKVANTIDELSSLFEKK